MPAMAYASLGEIKTAAYEEVKILMAPAAGSFYSSARSFSQK